MRKSTLKKIVVIPPVLLFVLLFILSIFGRQVGPKPLPWHVAWLAPFGEWGEQFSTEWAVQKATTKQEIIEILGEPYYIAIGPSGNILDATELDIYEARPDEVWIFGSSPDEVLKRAVRFANNEKIGR